MRTLRPADLAREHGISTQAVRNYEAEGFLPAAERTGSGYRIYTPVHAAALRAFLALVPAFGHAAGGEIMHALHRGDLDAALMTIDSGHTRLARDRQTLDSVSDAVEHLTASGAAVEPPEESWTIGELAHRVGVTPAALRNWEGAGILRPGRDRVTGYRRYGAGDVRDAELAFLLRRGGYPLESIAAVVEQVRTAGGTQALAVAMDEWRRKLTAQGLAMLEASARLSDYLAAARRP